MRGRRQRRAIRATRGMRLLAVAALGLLAACIAPLPPPSVPSSAGPSIDVAESTDGSIPATPTASPTPVADAEGDVPPFQRTFGPDYPAEPPPGQMLRLDGAVLSRDRRTLTVQFIGGKGFDAANPCTEDYGPWVGSTGDVLQVEIHEIDHPEQARPVEGTACTLEGYSYLFRLRLPEPFTGREIRDGAAGPMWVPPPEGIAELQPVPVGWRLSGVMVMTEGGARVLSRGYRPLPGDAARQDQYLALIQVFGGPPEHVVEAPVGSITIHGAEVPVGRNGDTGFLVSWRLGADGLTLISFDSDLTLEAFAAMANEVGIPGG